MYVDLCVQVKYLQVMLLKIFWYCKSHDMCEFVKYVVEHTQSTEEGDVPNSDWCVIIAPQ